MNYRRVVLVAAVALISVGLIVYYTEKSGDDTQTFPPTQFAFESYTDNPNGPSIWKFIDKLCKSGLPESAVDDILVRQGRASKREIGTNQFEYIYGADNKPQIVEGSSTAVIFGRVGFVAKYNESGNISSCKRPGKK